MICCFFYYFFYGSVNVTYMLINIIKLFEKFWLSKCVGFFVLKKYDLGKTAFALITSSSLTQVLKTPQERNKSKISYPQLVNSIKTNCIYHFVLEHLEYLYRAQTNYKRLVRGGTCLMTTGTHVITILLLYLHLSKQRLVYLFLLLLFKVLFLSFILFLTALCGKWNLSSLTRH